MFYSIPRSKVEVSLNLEKVIHWYMIIWIILNYFSLSENSMIVKATQSCLAMCDSMTIESMEFSRWEYRSGEPFPSSGDHCNPGIKLTSPAVPADSLPAEPQGKPNNTGVGSLSLLQNIFLNQDRAGDSLWQCRLILFSLRYHRSPI